MRGHRLSESPGDVAPAGGELIMRAFADQERPATADAGAVVEAANFARCYCVEARRFYERKKARTNGVVATKALAHKLARACYHMLKEQQPFDVKRCFAERGSMQKQRAL